MRPGHDSQVERHMRAQAFGESSETIPNVALRLFRVDWGAERFAEVVWRRWRRRSGRMRICGWVDETGGGGGGGG
jgi:hypothetical protein